MSFAETVFRGAPDPGTELSVLESPAGFYVGYRCDDGSPYSRETDYFDTKPDANMALVILKELLSVGADPLALAWVR